MRTHVNVQALTVVAPLTRKRDHIDYAATLAPHTDVQLDLGHIPSMVDD